MNLTAKTMEIKD